FTDPLPCVHSISIPYFFFFFKQKTAYEISRDWSSDVCSSDLKCTFIIGANDGILPARPNEEGVFSESDRETLADTGLQLAPGSRETLLDENFLIYCALTSPQEALYISYPLANEEGKSLLPSPIIKRLKDIFPLINERFYMNEPSELPVSEQLEYI